MSEFEFSTPIYGDDIFYYGVGERRERVVRGERRDSDGEMEVGGEETGDGHWDADDEDEDWDGHGDYWDACRISFQVCLLLARHSLEVRKEDIQ